MKAPILLCLALSLATAFAAEPRATEPAKPEEDPASKALFAGDYDTAIALCTEAIKANPKEPFAYNTRALAYRSKKENARALADFDQAIRLRPLPMFFYNRGVAHYETGDDKSAIADLTRALQGKGSGQPLREICLVTRARCYINQSQSAPALADLNAAIKLDPRDSEAYRLRGIIHKVAHQYDKSLADYEKAIALDPKSASAYGTEAYLLSVCPMPKYRDGPKAVQYATKACELTEWHSAQELDSLAAAYAETGDFDKAIEFQKKADQITQRTENERLALYEKHQPVRDLNRSENAVPLPETGKVAIKLGEKLVVHFDLDGERLVNPVPKKGEKLEPKSFTLDYRLYKGNRVLLLEHSLPQIIRLRCLARLKDYDVYFETDVLPVPPKFISRELWSEPIEELVLFDFHVNARAPEKSVTSRESARSVRPLFAGRR